MLSQMTLIQRHVNTIGTAQVLSELFCFLQRVKATWITFLLNYSSRVVVLVVDTEVSTLLFDTSIPGVVFWFHHSVSPFSVSAIRYP